MLALTMSAHAVDPFLSIRYPNRWLETRFIGFVFDALKIQPGDRVTDADISLATRALFETILRPGGGGAEGAVLVIEVTERPAVSRIDIEGNQRLKLTYWIVCGERELLRVMS